MRYPLALLICGGLVACDGDKKSTDPDPSAMDAAPGSGDVGRVDGQMAGGDTGTVADGAVVPADGGAVPDGRVMPTPDTGAVADMGMGSVPDAGISPPDMDPGRAGHVPTSCGDEGQGLMPVDCTARGDENAQCVFSNHCMCSDGFLCEDTGNGGECGPGVICIPRQPGGPEGSRADSCGADDQGLEPVDCTANGDVDAFCVFSNHCACSDGYVCDDTGNGGECAPGQSCVRAP